MKLFSRTPQPSRLFLEPFSLWHSRHQLPFLPRAGEFDTAVRYTMVRTALAVLAATAVDGACARKPPADRVRVSGQVEATAVHVAPPVGGRLLELRVAEGDRVKTGDLLAKLDVADTELALARAGAERDQADAQLRLLQA